MRVKDLSLCIFFIAIYACGPRISKSTDLTIKEVKAYVSEINANKNLKESFDEGALTDISGNIDKGHFKYFTYYDENILYHIKNIEITNKTVTENFYFKERELVYINTKTNNEPIKDMYIVNGKVINNTTVDPQYKEVLLNKAKLFQKEYNKSH